MKISFGVLIFFTLTKDSRQSLSCSPHDDGLELVSEGMAAYQSSTYQNDTYSISLPAYLAVDGRTTTYSRQLCSETASNLSSWWYVDLGQTTIVSKIRVYQRYGHEYKLDEAIVRVGNDSSAPFIGNIQCGYNLSSVIENGHNPVKLTCNPSITGQYVSVYLPTSEHLRLCEVQVFTDIMSPVVTCPANIKASSTIVTWDYPEVTDNLDTDLPLTCTPPSGSSFAVGSTDVKCSATDAAGNTFSCMFTVSITGNSNLTDTNSTLVSTSTMFPTSTIVIVASAVISVLMLSACLIFYRYKNHANKHKPLRVKTVGYKTDSYDTQPKERERPDSAGIDNIYDYIIEPGATAQPETYEIPTLSQELYMTPIES